MMMHTSKLICLCLLVPHLFGAVPPPEQWGGWQSWGDQGDGTYRNPVLPGDYADIDCIRVGSDYYAISSTFQYSPGMVILHSKDLVNWSIAGHAINDVTEISPRFNWDRMNGYARGVWAGAIRYHDGKFWVYFGTPDEGYFMTTAKDVAGPWEPLHQMTKEGGWDDCCPFWDDDGQGYFVGTHFSDNYKTWLYKLTPDGRDIIPDSRILINEGMHREASKLFKVGDTYYHFFSEVGDGGRYVMMQRAKSITGPYAEKQKLSHVQAGFHEPNQGGIVQTEAGDWYFLTHHGHGDWEGRPASLLPVTWVDGWPILGNVGEDGVGTMIWGGEKPVKGTPVVVPQSSDEFNGPALGLQWEWNFQPRMDKWSLTERRGFLRLHAFKPLREDQLKTAGNTLTQRSMRTANNVATLALDISGLADGQVAGLCHYSGPNSTIGVRREGSTINIEFSLNGTFTSGPRITSRKLWLRSTWGLDGLSRYAYSTDGKNFTEFGEPSQLAWGDYRGDRIGIFTYNNKGEAGHIDCDSFTYDYNHPAKEAGANGLILGSWNSQVEFDAVQVVCGDSSGLADSFDRETPGWIREGGEWNVENGMLHQNSSAAPALIRYPFNCETPDYTVQVRVRKTGGAEGFLIGFGAQDEKNYYWLNLGGWSNARHQLEKTWDGSRFAIGPAVNGTIETGRWYDVRIEVRGDLISCFLDDRKIIEARDSGFALLPFDGELGFGRPLIPDLVADPSIVDINGMFYCYATTDGWGQHLSTSGTPVVWTSRDFVNWSFEGSIFPDNFDAKYWAPGAPIEHDGRYYLFPTLDGQITTTVSDSLTGPFKTLDDKDIYPGSGWKPFPIPQQSAIDAEIFRDDDGQCYMFYSRRRVVKLKPDLSGPDGPVVTIDTGEGNYSEGPWVFKRKGIYYYLYTLGGGESYSYAYLMSRESPMGPWTIPADKIIAQTDLSVGIYGPGHGCFVNPAGTDDWYFIHLEFGRSSTNRQIFGQKMEFNADGTIQAITLTNQGIGALRSAPPLGPNLAIESSATASSVRPDWKISFTPPSPGRIETFSPELALDGSNGTRWMAAPGDASPWFQVDLGEARDIQRTEAYFVKPAAGHAYKLEWSLDGQNWQPYGGHDEVILRSPHRDEKTVRARYLKLTVLKGEPGLWEFRVY